MSPLDSPGFAAYLAARNQQRRDDVDAKWTALTGREQALVREAAVMGFVQGVRATAAPPPNPFPKDHEIVATVLDSVDPFADLYPTLASLGEVALEDVDHEHS